MPRPGTINLHAKFDDELNRKPSAACPEFNGSSSLPSRGGKIFGEPGDPSLALGVEWAYSERDAAKERANKKQQETNDKPKDSKKKETTNNQQQKQHEHPWETIDQPIQLALRH